MFNVGTGRATSVNELAAALIAAVAPGTQPAHAPAQAGELRNAIADVSAIHRALGWSARRVPIDFTDVVESWKSRSP